MADGYSRQSSFTDGDIIQAAHGNLEFNKIVKAFNEINGHNHDGTETGGAPIPLLKDLTGVHNLTLTAAGITGSVISDDAAFTANSSTLIPTQAAVKAFVDAGNYRLLTAGGISHFTLQDSGITGTHVDDDGNLTANSAGKLATQRAVKAYVDEKNNLTSDGQTFTVGSSGVGGTLIEHSTLLPVSTIPAPIPDKLPTTAAVKGYADNISIAQNNARASQAVVDSNARDAIILTADTDRTATATNLANAIAASEAKPHVGKLQQSPIGGTSSVECKLDEVEILGPTLDIRSLGGDALFQSSVGSNSYFYGGTNAYLSALNGSVDISAAAGYASLTALGGNLNLASANANVDIDATLGTTTVSSATGTRILTDSGSTDIDSPAGGINLVAQDTAYTSATNVHINATNVIQLDGAITGSGVSNDVTMAANSSVLIPTQQAAKGYIDNLMATSSAPVNTASLAIQDSTTVLDKTSLTIDGPASTTRGGRINLQAGTSDTNVNDTWIQKVNDALVLGQQANDIHKFHPATVTLNSGTTTLTTTTSNLPGLSWDTSVAILGSGAVATFTGNNTNFQNGAHVLTGSTINLLSGAVVFDSTNSSIPGFDWDGSQALVGSGGTALTLQANGDANFGSGQSILSSSSASLVGGQYTFDSGKAKFLNDQAWLSDTDAKLGNGNLNLTDSAFNLHQGLFAVNESGSDTHINKEITTELGDKHLVIQNLNESGGTYLRATGSSGSHDVFGAIVSGADTYSVMNFSGLTRLQTLQNGVAVTGDAGNQMVFHHDGNNAFWDNDTSGDLYIRNNVAGKNVWFSSDKPDGTPQTSISILSSATGNYTQLYQDNSTRLQTAADGVLTYGAAGHSLYTGHNGTDGYLDNVDMGHFYIRNQVIGKDLVFSVDDTLGVQHTGLRLNGGSGAPNVDLFYDGNTRLATDANGIAVKNGAYSTAVYKHQNGDGELVNHDSGDLRLRNEVSGRAVYIQVRNASGALVDSQVSTWQGSLLNYNGGWTFGNSNVGCTIKGGGDNKAAWYHDSVNMRLHNLDAGGMVFENEVSGQGIDFNIKRSDGNSYSGVLQIVSGANAKVRQRFDDRDVTETLATGLKIGWNGYGTCDFGAQNASYFHMITDRPEFYFNKPLAVDGGSVHDYGGNWTLEDGGLKLSAGRQVFRDLGDGFLYTGEGYSNGLYTPNNIRTDAALHVGGTGMHFSASASGVTILGAGNFNVNSTSATLRGYDLLNEKNFYAPIGITQVTNSGVRRSNYNTWDGAFTFNIDPIATLTLDTEFVFHKNHKDSTITINLTGLNSNSLYGPWGSATDVLTIPAGTSGSVTLRYVGTNVIMTTLNLTNHE